MDRFIVFGKIYDPAEAISRFVTEYDADKQA